MPTRLLKELAGRRIAIAGFADEDTARLRRAIDEADGFCRVLDLVAMSRPAESLRAFDGALLALTEATLEPLTAWTAEKRPVVFAATPQQVAAKAQVFSQPWCHFVVSPWDAMEVLIRLTLAIRAQAPEGASDVARPTIVLADDDPSITALLKATLNRQGVDCHVAPNGGDALTLARQLHPKVIVLDVNMPQHDGFEVLAALRAEPATRDIRVIMLTGCEQESDVLRGFGLGTDDYVTKPFNPMEVAARIRRLLGATA